MEEAFWHERWAQNQIGFHCETVNPHLQEFWSTLAVSPASCVFVPLCGKSQDMLWLLAQGYSVMGVELSPLAVAAFFSENGLSATNTIQGQFSISEADALRLYCGDFFDLTATDLAGCAAVYDRAALVALPPPLRAQYAAHLQQLLKQGTRMLLVTFVYSQPEMQGPPFSVPMDEVQLLFADWCAIEQLHSQDILAQEPRFRERGLTQLQEQVYCLTVL